MKKQQRCFNNKRGLEIAKSLGWARKFFNPWGHQGKMKLLYTGKQQVLYFQFLVIHICTYYVSGTYYLLTNIIQSYFSIEKMIDKCNNITSTSLLIFYILGWSMKCKIDRTISLKGKEATKKLISLLFHFCNKFKLLVHGLIFFHKE